MVGTQAKLIIMRHGESTWTDKRINRFAGWADIPLTARGEEQAFHASQLLTTSGIKPDMLFTSMLRRSIHTADIVLDALDRLWIPVERSWRLNERHYGAFQGQTRPAMREQFGEQQFNLYRRSFDVRPPEIDLASPYFQGNDPRYTKLFSDNLDSSDPSSIRSECLKDVWLRLEPFWNVKVLPELAEGKTVLIVTHGSVVRSLVKYLEGINDTDIASINVPTGIPMSFDFSISADNIPVVQGAGQYLDPEAAQLGIAETSALGNAEHSSSVQH
jgi:2,3-bisphosphoglycerate-dependent phosphoglycerate mutase